MKYFVLIFSLIFANAASAGAQIPFLFMPRKSSAPVFVLAGFNWDPDFPYLQFDGFGPGFNKTVTMVNNEPTMSNTLIVTLSNVGTGFTIVADTCSGALLLPGGSCTIEINFNGMPNPPDEMLSVTDGFNTTLPMTIHNCSAC